MRRLLLVAAAVAMLAMALGTTTVQAAPGAGTNGAMKGQSHEGGLFAKLNLTPDQKAQIKTILTKARADAKAATDKPAKKAIWKAAFEQIKTTVLTDAQRAQLAQMMGAGKGVGGKGHAASGTKV